MIGKTCRLTTLCAAVILMSAAGSFVEASELDAQIGKILKTFVKASSEEGRALSASTLSVFPFSTDAYLSKKRVDVAVGELLTQGFLAKTKFKLVERNQLDVVLKEQRLGLSGVIESRTAAEVGKVMGVRLAVLGNVSLIGRSYQVSAKLVDTGSSEIIATEIVEVPVRVFDEEASRYLVLVPEFQTLGVYLAMSQAKMKVANLDPALFQSVTIVPGNSPQDYQFAGIGIRYWPWRSYMLDFAFLPKVNTKLSHTPLYSFSGGGDPPTVEPIPAVTLDSTQVRLIGSRSVGLLKSLTAYVGAGASLFITRPDEPVPGFERSATSPTVHKEAITIESDPQTYINPLVRLGVEWRPQARFGMSVLGIYNLSPQNYKIKANLRSYSGGGGGGVPIVELGTESMTVHQVEFPRFILETNLSFYF